MEVTKALADEIQDVVQCILDENGREVNSPVPHESSFSLRPKLSLQKRIERIMRSISLQAGLNGHETEEEANDFSGLDEDEEPFTQYQVEAMIDEIPLPAQEPPASPTPAELDPPEPAPSPEQGQDPPEPKE